MAKLPNDAFKNVYYLRTINLPANLALVESSLHVNGVLCTNYTYNSSSRRITIPVSEATITIKYSAQMTADSEMMSYALFTYTKSGVQKQEVIGIIREDMETLTLNTTDLTSERAITVEGAAPAESTVYVYVDVDVDGTLAAEVQASKNGTFIATGHFDGDNYLYVPGTLGIEYNLKAEDIQISDTVDWSWIEGHLSNQLLGSAVVENGTIDNLYSYVSDKYTIIVDMRDTVSIRLIVAEDGADAWTLTLTMSGENALEDIATLGGTLNAFTSAADVAYNTYGIMDDHNKLLEDI